MGIFKRVFGKKESEQPSKEKPKKKRKQTMMERLLEQRMLADPKWANEGKFDVEAATNKIFKRKGIIKGQEGVPIVKRKVIDHLSDGTPVFDAEEDPANEARKQDREESAEYFNPYKIYGLDPKVLEFYESRVFIGYASMAHLATHELISGVCDIPPKEAIAKGYTFEFIKNDDKDDKDDDGVSDTQNADTIATILKDAEEVYKIGKVCRTFGFQKRAFGVSYCIPVFTDGDAHDYSNPFNPDGIAKDSFVGMKVIEPIWMTYEFKNSGANSPASIEFYEPEWYRVAGGGQIHKSWVVKSVHVPVSDLLKPTYFFGGVSVTQMIYERMYCADKTANEAPMLVMTKRLLVADANVQAMVSDNNVAKLTMQALNYFRDNYSVFFKNPNTQVSQIDTSLEGVAPTSMMQYQLAAAIGGMPVTKLLKNVPTGLQSTGDYEMDDYHEMLEDIRKDDFAPIFSMFLKCYCQSKFGRQMEVRVKFNPLEVIKRKDMIQEETQVASVTSNYLSSNVITIEEAREMLRNRKDGLWAFLKKELPEQLQKRKEAELKKLDNEINPPQNPMGGAGGIPPAGGGGGGQELDDPAAQAEIDATAQAVAEAEKVLNGGGGDVQE